MNEKRYWIGFDLGGTKQLALVLDERFETLGRIRRKNKGGSGPVAGLTCIGDTIEAVISDAGLDVGQINGIGFGAAGFLDLEKGTILHSPNLGWRKVAVRDHLRQRFGVPVALLNDVDAGTYGEYRLGAARKARCVVSVFPGTGIGGACIYEGRLIRGGRASAMEIGHVCVQPNGNLCGCGRYGCLETVAGRLAIASQIAVAACREGTSDLRKLAGTDVAAIRSGAIARAIHKGNPVVGRIVRHAARQIGLAMVAPLHLLAPDTILLGGGLVEEMPDIFVGEIQKALREQGIASFVKGLTVTVASLGDDAVAKGAAVFVADDEAVHS